MKKGGNQNNIPIVIAQPIEDENADYYVDYDGPIIIVRISS